MARAPLSGLVSMPSRSEMPGGSASHFQPNEMSLSRKFVVASFQSRPNSKKMTISAKICATHFSTAPLRQIGGRSCVRTVTANLLSLRSRGRPPSSGATGH